MDDARPSGWVRMHPAGSLGGRIGQTVRLPAAPPADPHREDWPRPRKFSGPLTPVIGLVGAVSADGWDVEPRALRFFPKELADELIKSRQVRLANPGEVPAADE